MVKANTNELWQQYLKARDYLRYINLYDATDECFRFYEGEQWRGIRTYGERCASLNILKPIVDYKVSTVAMNNLAIYYSSMNYGKGYDLCAAVCEKLNFHAARLWEKLKMDKLIWDIVRDAAICGDGFLYFYDVGGAVNAENVSNVRILLADETLGDIQRQPYILIEQRMSVEDARRLAKKNGISEVKYCAICADEDETLRNEMQGYAGYGRDKCTVVTKLYKKDGCVYVEKAAKNCVVSPPCMIEGLTLYPIAHYCWNRQKDRARGVGEINYRTPNQIEINRGLVRLLTGIKQYAYPHIVYDGSVISKDNIEKLGRVGTHIALSSNRMERVSDAIGYLQPAQISSMASDVIFSLVDQTRDLAGAGEAVLGQINPENASGAAIIAVKDAAAQPLNMQVASLKDFAEDIARIWYDIWTAYNPNGLEVIIEGEGKAPYAETIPPQVLETLKIDVKVDISPANAFSKFAAEQSLENLFAKGAITFEEYAEALSDDSTAPKAQLMKIIEKRASSEPAAEKETKAAAQEKEETV